jgi:negative regulator of replication initiation
MMPTIRIDEDVWRFLQSKAKPFEDSPNDVLRRELGIGRGETPNDVLRRHLGLPKNESVDEVQGTVAPNSGKSSNATGDFLVLTPDKDYSHQIVRGYQLKGRHYPARSFKDVLVGVCNQLISNHKSGFANIALRLHGRKRVYFSRNPEDLKFPQQLANSDVFVETNLNANLIVGICQTLLVALDLEFDSLKIE